MKRVVCIALVILSAFAVPVEAQAPVWSATITKNDPTNWILVINREATEIVRFQVRKLAGRKDEEFAREVAVFIAKQMEAETGVDIKNLIRTEVGGL